MSDPWKACDIRGIYPTDVSTELFWRLGRSIASSLPEASRILIAGDFRVSTPDLKRALADGLLESGADVLDSGQIPTPIAYFAHHRWKTSAVLIVTASHNPSQFNGLKLMLGHLPPSPEDLRQLRRTVEEGVWRDRRGKHEEVDPVPSYSHWLLERWGQLRQSHSQRVVLDAGNGAWSELGPALFKDLGFHVHPLFCVIDGSFPNRSPDCARSGSLAAVRARVTQTGAHLGIAWDADGDRVAVIDNAGSVVSTDEMSALIVRDLVPREPAAPVIYDVKLSEIVGKTIVECGGNPIMQRSGHAFIKRSMIERNALFGCEVTGHYFFRELNGGDDGLFAAVYLADLVRRRGVTLADLRSTLAPFFITPDLRIPSAILNYDEIVRRLGSLLPSARTINIDGVRWETEKGYLLARQSVTEPVVTLRLEGRTQKLLQDLIDLCRLAIPEAANEISAQLDQRGARNC